jgi:hypothetical protein
MGCDIHAYIDYDYFYMEKKTKEYWVRNFATVNLNRNYSLFYALANVRYDPNRMPPNQGLEPKGLPKDVSDYVKNSAEDWSSDMHSSSWLTVKELKDAYQRYLSWKEAPDCWYQLVPPEVQSVPEKAKVKEVTNEYLGTKEWYIEVGRRVKNPPIPEIEAVIAAMEKLNGDNILRSRLVFWFDN